MTRLAPSARARASILAGACATVIGLIVAGTAPVVGVGPPERIRDQQATGGVLVLIGWILLGWGIHRFGRQRDE